MSAYVQDSIVLFGDSITQGSFEPGLNGFGQRLAHVYARKLDVINRGLSGYNTEWALPVFKQCFTKKLDQEQLPKVRLLIIWFGANDACIKPSPQHVPLPKFVSNLRDMIDIVSSPDSPHYSPLTRIILVTPPPINTIQRGSDLAARDPPMALDRLFDVTRSYAEAVKEVAASKNIALVDAWSAVWEAAGRIESNLSQFTQDGLHLNARGYEVMYDALIKTIGDKHPELHYDKLQYVFARWDEINWNDPSKSLDKRVAMVD